MARWMPAVKANQPGRSRFPPPVRTGSGSTGASQRHPEGSGCRAPSVRESIGALSGREIASESRTKMNQVAWPSDWVSRMGTMDRTPERTPDQIYDEWLVIRSQDGDRAAMGELVMRWDARLVGLAIGLTGRDDAARDAVQSAWLAAARDIARLNDPTRFPEWICRIVSNKCADFVRRVQRQRGLERGKAANQSVETVNPPVAAGDLEEVRRLRAALAAMAPAQRELLALHYGASLGVASIAEMLRVPVGTVKSRLHAARRELREAMERKGP